MLVSSGARSKWVTAPPHGTAQPSPLEGEGGRRRRPGEGEAASAASSAAKSRHPNRDTARRLRKTMTDAERKLWSLLRSRKLAGCKFRRQVPIGPYVADFLSHECHLIVETDGGQHARSPHAPDRDAWFRHHGFTVARYWKSDVLDNPDGVLADLTARAATEQEALA
ncbi:MULTISPECIES: DUF559 domain-containing protein [Rhodomicrobium]|uniref:endonuclease domain-containing protein n=2 Tax=Rhodomicrobium TaxID=1068 RepID=UPI000B4A86DE